MANIRVTVDQPLYTGMPITFRAPCDSTSFANLVVDYPNTDGTTNTAMLTICNAQGETVTEHVCFCADSLVTVIVCCDSNKAYLMNHAGNVSADYVVEQGTSGIWTYRKWASGMRECWGTATTTANVSNGVGVTGIVAGSTQPVGENYPEGLFSEIPHSRWSLERIEKDGTYYNGWGYTAGIGTAERTPMVTAAHFGSAVSGATVGVNFYAIGR